MIVRPFFQFLQQLFAQPDSQRLLLFGVVGVILLAVGMWLLVRLRRPSMEEMERRRRERLAKLGRITDGSLIDTRTLTNEESSSRTPEVLVYRYRVSGVVYECAQDVSYLPDRLHDCQVGNAVQVRYDPRNPGDSILLAETWSGLWLPTQGDREARQGAPRGAQLRRDP